MFIGDTAEPEMAAKKILKLVQVNGTAIRCTYNFMTVQEWGTQKRDANDDIETWLGFAVTQDWSWLFCVCETLLARMNLKQWQPKRRLSTIFNNFNDYLKAKVNMTYLYLGGDVDIQADDGDVGKIFDDLLECWLQGVKYIIRKEALGLQLIENQRDFFERSCDMEDIPIMVLTKKINLHVEKTLCQEASAALDTRLVFVRPVYPVLL